MPELPEVETTRRGVAEHLVDGVIEAVVVREPRLRWPVESDLPSSVAGRTVTRVERRAKYLVITLDEALHLMIHLGMSGSLRIAPSDTPATAHDHVDIVIRGGRTLRLNDPRRFGSLHLVRGAVAAHPLISRLGPEPLQDGFNGDYLHALSRGRRVSVKAFIMNSRVVVGVGNIYATEALFRAGIHPARPARRVGRARYRCLATAITEVLEAAIEAGGTTLRDFTAGDGRPGYFRHSLDVYGRAGEVCRRCGTALRQRRIGQRSTVYCPSCQR